MSLSGIYCIEDARGILYYGSATNLKKRISNHKTFLKQGKHQNPKLQRAWDKYGEDFFSFYVVEVVTDKSRLLEREQWWIDQLVASEDDYYNILLVAGSQIGKPCSEETKRKISEANKGKVRTKEALENLSKARKGLKLNREYIVTDEARKKTALTLSGGKIFSLIGPDNTIYDNIVNLTDFARQHNLSQGNLWSLVSGKYKSHKGFRLLSITILEEYKK